jgi:hypothetical protein
MNICSTAAFTVERSLPLAILALFGLALSYEGKNFVATCPLFESVGDLDLHHVNSMQGRSVHLATVFIRAGSVRMQIRPITQHLVISDAMQVQKVRSRHWYMEVEGESKRQNPVLECTQTRRKGSTHQFVLFLDFFIKVF